MSMKLSGLALAFALCSPLTANAGKYGPVVNPAQVVRARPGQVTAYDAAVKSLNFNLRRDVPQAVGVAKWRVQFGHSPVLGTTFRATGRDANLGRVVAKGTVGSNHSLPRPSNWELNSVAFTVKGSK